MSFQRAYIFDAMLFVLSGYAFADGLAVPSPDELAEADILSTPVTVVSPITEPKRYWLSLGMEYPRAQGNPLHPQTVDFSSAQVPHGFPTGTGNATPTSDATPQRAAIFFHMGPSTALQLSLDRSSNTALPGGEQPKRRLSLIVGDWAFSGSARVFSDNKSVTFTIRRKF